MREKGVLLPDLWICGPDPIDHKLYTDCQRARAQAWFRNEEWLITEAEFIALWRKDDQYLNRGRASTNVCLTRIDPEGAWSLDNVEIISRLTHYRACHQRRVEGTRSRQARKKIEEVNSNAKSRI
jgi:hypothetical protein